MSNNADSYQKEQLSKMAFVNDLQGPLTSTSQLATLKLLHELKGAAGGEDLIENLPGFLRQETKYMEIASRLIQGNDFVKAKMGTDFNAVLRLAGIVKNRVNDIEFNQVIDSGITDADLQFNGNGRYRGPDDPDDIGDEED